MEPVARRTRRQRYEALIKEYGERKKFKPAVTVPSHPSPEQRSSGWSSSSSSSSESESESETGSTCSPVLPKVEKDDLLISSSSESEEESEESDYAKEEAVVEVEVEDEFSAFGTRECPIVLGAGDEDEDEDEEEEEEKVEEEKEVMVKKNKTKVRPSKGPLTATEIQKVLLNSMMEEVVEEAVPHKSPEPSYSSEVDSGEEMKIEDPQQDEIDDGYRIMNACLAFSETGVFGTRLADEHSTKPFKRKNEDSKKNQRQLCREGKHDLILEDEVGVICRFCHYIREEIRHVYPPFHPNPFATSYKDDEYRSDYRGSKKPLYFEDPNIEAQHFKSGVEFDTTGTVWEIMPGLRDGLLPQQREAFEFIWRNVAGGTNLNELMNKKKIEGGGCLVSHAPGTGKTRLAIAFLQTYMKFSKNSRPVVLAPASILLSWKHEFQKWKVDVPFLNLNEDELSEAEMSTAASLFGKSYLTNLDTKSKRLIKLLFWKRHESVLAISYSLFPILVEQDEMLRKLLIETPGILVLDEAHMPRNERSQMFKVLKKVKTKKRILLSGTPFQNNFRELRNILCLVRKEFNNEIDPFKKSGVDESDERKIRELKEKMKPFCHCCGNHVLIATLPGLVENNIYLQPSEHQKSLLKLEEEQRKNHLEANANMTLISLHPMLLHCKDRKTDVSQELESGKWDISDSVKTRFLIRFIQLSSALEERVLVFSQYREPLNFIKSILESNEFGWREGIEIHLMNGSQEMETRKRTMDLFNKERGKAKVMLASTKACSEGIELTGASRVILLDVAWNPAVEKQAISRAFRMGQQRVVHVYHLIMTGNDSNRYQSQSKKNSFSNYMFSLNNKKADDGSRSVSEDIILERLREENIILEAKQVKTNDSGSSGF